MDWGISPTSAFGGCDSDACCALCDTDIVDDIVQIIIDLHDPQPPWKGMAASQRDVELLLLAAATAFGCKNIDEDTRSAMAHAARALERLVQALHGSTEFSRVGKRSRAFSLLLRRARWLQLEAASSDARFDI